MGRTPRTSCFRVVLVVALASGCSSSLNGDVGVGADERRRQPACPSVQEPIAEIVLVGDTMFDGELAVDLADADPTLRGTVGPVRDLVEPAELALLNLETTVGAPGDPIDKSFTFNSAVAGLEALAWAGFDVANVANNHILDYGAAGLEATLGHVRDLGLAATGICHAGEPQVPLIVDAGGIEVGILGYADAEEPFAYAEEFFGYATRPAEADEEAIARDLEALLPRVDLVVISVHWGRENNEVTARQRELGHFMIDHGASVVAGHHPHVQQAAEWYAGGLIVYSLGNFVFGLWSDPRHLESRLYRVRVQASRVLGADYIPLLTDLGTWAPTPVSGTPIAVQ